MASSVNRIAIATPAARTHRGSERLVAVGTTRLGVLHLGGLTQLAEVLQASGPVSGTEAQTSLDEAREGRRSGHRQQQVRDGRRIDRHQQRGKADRAGDAQPADLSPAAISAGPMLQTPGW